MARLRARCKKLFGGLMRSRDTVGDAAKWCSNESCSGGYQANAEAILHEIHEVAGRRTSAKQLLNGSLPQAFVCKLERVCTGVIHVTEL